MKIYGSFDDLPEAVYHDKRCKIVGTRPSVSNSFREKQGTYYDLAFKSKSGDVRYFKDVHSDAIDIVSDVTFVAGSMGSAVPCYHPPKLVKG